MSGASTQLPQQTRTAQHPDRTAVPRARWALAADAVDEHAATCGCYGEPCDEALRLTEGKIEAWDWLDSASS